MAYKDPETERAYARNYYLKNRERIKARARAYHSKNHAAVLARKRAYRIAHREQQRAWSKNNPDKVRAAQKRCKDKQRQHLASQQRAYYAAHRDEILRKQKAYKQQHPTLYYHINLRYLMRKRQAAQADLTPEQWQEIQAAYGFRCVYCGKKPRTLEMDHITAVSRGGNHTVTNIVPACRTCNAKKHAGEPPIAVQPLLLTIAKSSQR